MPEPWLSKRELAAHLKVSPRTIERLKPPYLRVGGMNRYKLSQVERYLSASPGAPDNVVKFPSAENGRWHYRSGPA